MDSNNIIIKFLKSLRKWFVKTKVIENIYIQNDYEITEYFRYENNILTNKAVSVKQISTHKNICFRNFESLNGVLSPKYTEKSFYLPDGKLKYFFDYDSEGNAEIIYDEEFEEKIYSIHIGIDPNEEFTWEGFEYYRHIEPTIPKQN